MSVKPAVEKYSLYQFTLSPSSGTTPAPTPSVLIGSYVDIEEAFTTASRIAYNELRNAQLAMKYAESVEKANSLKVNSTEYGYDLVCEHRIILRLWIHVSIGS